MRSSGSPNPLLVSRSFSRSKSHPLGNWYSWVTTRGFIWSMPREVRSVTVVTVAVKVWDVLKVMGTMLPWVYSTNNLIKVVGHVYRVKCSTATGIGA